MSHKSVLATSLFGLLCLQFCHLLQAAPTNNEDLASAFQDFTKKAVAEMLAQRRYLEQVDNTLGPLMRQLKNGTNPMETNAENIRVIARAVQSLGSTVEANERKVAGPAMVTTSQCGGFIPLEGSQEILYQVPVGLPYFNCIWVIWAKHGGPIRLKNEPNSNANFDGSFELIAAHNFSKTGWDKDNLPSGSEIMLGTSGSLNTFAVLFFQGNVTKLGQGVHLKFEDTGARNSTPLRPNFKLLSLSQGSGSLKYPSGSLYENNERVFAIGQVPEGKSLDIEIPSVDTEVRYDWFRIMWLEDSILKSFKYSGSSVSSTPLMIPGGCSYIIIFKSDATTTGAGIRLSYKVNERNIL